MSLCPSRRTARPRLNSRGAAAPGPTPTSTPDRILADALRLGSASGPSPEGLELGDLMVRLARKRLYVILTKPTTSWDVDMNRRETLLREHLLWLMRIEGEGRLFAAGPLDVAGTEWAGNGLCIVRAGSVAEATEIGSQDPFVIAGLKTISVHSWALNEGSLTLTVRLLNQVIEIG